MRTLESCSDLGQTVQVLSVDQNSMEGTYKLADDTTGRCRLSLKEEEGGKLRLRVKVANYMDLVLTKIGDKWTPGPIERTKGIIGIAKGSKEVHLRKTIISGLALNLH